MKTETIFKLTEEQQKITDELIEQYGKEGAERILTAAANKAYQELLDEELEKECKGESEMVPRGVLGLSIFRRLKGNEQIQKAYTKFCRYRSRKPLV